MDSHGSCENHRLWTIWTLKINTPSRSISPLMGLGCIQSKQLSSVLSYIDRIFKQLLIWILQIFTVTLRSINKLQRKSVLPWHPHDLSTTNNRKTPPKNGEPAAAGTGGFSFAQGAVQVRKWLSSLGTSFFSPARPVNRRTGRPKNLRRDERGKLGINHTDPEKIGWAPFHSKNGRIQNQTKNEWSFDSGQKKLQKTFATYWPAWRSAGKQN